jgi:aspartyl-tRNA synthetase
MKFSIILPLLWLSFLPAAWAQDAASSTASPPVVAAPKQPARHKPKHGKIEKTGPRTPTAQDAADQAAAETAAAARAKAQADAKTRAALAAKAKAEAAVAIASGKTKPVANIGSKTGLPLPRYASLRADRVNMRVGPGSQYPVAWEYHRADLPVKIIREFDIWRLIVDMDKVEGWVQSATLTGHRSFVVTSTEPAILREAASEDAEPVAKLMPGALGRIKLCDANATWCQVSIGGYKGFLRRTDFWGSDPGEAVTP